MFSLNVQSLALIALALFSLVSDCILVFLKKIETWSNLRASALLVQHLLHRKVRLGKKEDFVGGCCPCVFSARMDFMAEYFTSFGK